MKRVTAAVITALTMVALSGCVTSGSSPNMVVQKNVWTSEVELPNGQWVTCVHSKMDDTGGLQCDFDRIHKEEIK